MVATPQKKKTAQLTTQQTTPPSQKSGTVKPRAAAPAITWAALSQDLGERRAGSSSSKKTNIILYGDSGYGKTMTAATGIRPVLVDSWDPTGALSIRHWEEEGWVRVDDSWETPSLNRAVDWIRYDRTLRERMRSRIFDSIGTYVLDSITTLSVALLEWGYMEAGKESSSGVPDGRAAYGIAQKELQNLLTRICSLPCDVVVTAHPDKVIVTDLGVKELTPQFIGRVKSPMALFSEIYYVEVKRTLKDDPKRGRKIGDPVRSLLINPDGIVRAKSRLNNRGQIPIRVEPNLRALRKLAGLPTEDKPY